MYQDRIRIHSSGFSSGNSPVEKNGRRASDCRSRGSPIRLDAMRLHLRQFTRANTFRDTWRRARNTYGHAPARNSVRISAVGDQSASIRISLTTNFSFYFSVSLAGSDSSRCRSYFAYQRRVIIVTINSHWLEIYPETVFFFFFATGGEFFFTLSLSELNWKFLDS